MQIKKESYCNSFDKGCCEEIKNVKKEVLYDIEQKKKTLQVVMYGMFASKTKIEKKKTKKKTD